VQAVAPVAAMYWPATQDVHAVTVAPGVEKNFPVVQLVQLAEPAVL